MSTEKSTYVVYQRGRDPEKLRLGNLVMFPRNPQENDPYICPYKLDDLLAWTGKPQEDPNPVITLKTSKHASGGVEVVNLIGVDVSGGESSYINIEGKHGRRFEIDQATDFLNKVVMQLPEAKTWLDSRLAVSRKLYYLNQLKVGKASHPQVWMVTGLYLVSDASIQSKHSGSSKIVGNVKFPVPEPASAVAATLLKGGGVEAKVNVSSEAKGSHKYSHKDERVWAAQFRQLKVNFRKEGEAAADSTPQIALRDLLDLGRLGMKDYEGQEDGGVEVTGVKDADADEMLDMTDEDLALFEKLRIATSKRALLIGGAAKSLRGIQNDLKAMSTLLIDQGFDVTVCFGDHATRNGIFTEWRRLIDQTSSTDAVVVYYSGHGSISLTEATDESWRIQYILPTDFEQTKDDDFRGILDSEISHFLRGLTRRTDNVTLLLDCCHSEGMGREDGGFQERSLPSAVLDEHIFQHRNKLKELDGFREGGDVGGNPKAVRVVAAESGRLAYEGPDSKGQIMGRLTGELVKTIGILKGESVSWNWVLARLRNSLYKAGDYSQRPQVEGPSMRALFSLDRPAYWGQLPLKKNAAKVTLMGGLLTGVQQGDVYAIMDAEALSIDPTKQIAEVTVRAVKPTTADVALVYKGKYVSVPDGAVAFPLKIKRSNHKIRVEANESISKSLRHKVDSSRFIQSADAADNNTAPFATIKQLDGKLALLNRDAVSIFEYPLPVTGDIEEVANEVTYQLEVLARADKLLTLDEKANNSPLRSSLSVVLGSVEYGKPNPITEEHKILSEGQLAYIELTNDGKTKIYVSVFHIDIIGVISLISTEWISGIELPPGNSYTLGKSVYSDTLEGFTLSWPDSVPRDGPRDESIIVIVTSGPVDLQYLDSQYYPKLSPEEDGGRGWEPPTVFQDQMPDVRYSVHRISYEYRPSS